MTLSTAKISSLGILLVMSLMSGLILPILVLRNLKKYCSGNTFRKIISIMNCVSGGVFLATCLLGLLPEGREQIKRAQSLLKTVQDFPLTELVAGIGFLVILLVESFAMSCHNRHAAGKPKPPTECEDIESKIAVIKEHTFENEVAEHSFRNGVNQFSDPHVAKSDSNNEHSQQCVADEVYANGKMNLRNMMLIMALSIHMVFEGLELGLLETDTAVWTLLLALGIHKVLIFFSTGLTLYENSTFKKVVLAMSFMSLVSPIGVAIGIVMSSQETSVAMVTVSAILQALAIGTFLYVIFFEILWKQFLTNDDYRISKSIATILGFTVLAVLKYAVPE